MKQRTKFTMFAVGSLAFALAAIGGAGMISDQKIAAAENPSAIGVSMVKGASVRIGDGNAVTDQGNGMRFAMQMNKEKYEALIADGSCGNFEFGVIITPATESYADISYDTVFGNNKKYDWAVWTESEAGSGSWVYNHVEGYTQIMLYSFDEMYEAGIHDDPANVYVRGTISKIQNIAEEYNGWGYVRYEKDGKTVSEFVAPETRSMTYVAQRAVEDNNEYSEFLTAQYIAPFVRDSVKATTTTYTREYYFEKADGTYARNDELTETVANDVYINDTISDEAGKKRVEGYVFNSEAEGNVLSGKAYANGKLTLKRYYNILNADDMVQNAADINVKRENYEWGGANMKENVLATETLVRDGETVMSNGYVNTAISKTAAFKLELGAAAKNWDNTIAFTLSKNALSKAVLGQLIEDGYDSLRFSIYRTYGDGTTQMGLATRTINFDKMRENNASASDRGTAVKNNYDYAVPVSTKYLKPYDNGGNIWHQTEYALEDLLEFYDVLFAENSAYFLYEAGIYTKDAGTYYLSAFELKKYDVENLITDTDMINARVATYGGSDTMESTLLRTVEYSGETISNSDDESISKTAAFKIPQEKMNTNTGNQTIFNVAYNFMSKDVLKKFIADGYSKLTFAIYRQVDISIVGKGGWGIYKGLIDFNKMEGASVSDSGDTFQKRYSFTEPGSSTNKWQTVEFNLSDLLTYYDILFYADQTSPFYLCSLGMWGGYAGAVYISQFALTK